KKLRGQIVDAPRPDTLEGRHQLGGGAMAFRRHQAGDGEFGGLPRPFQINGSLRLQLAVTTFSRAYSVMQLSQPLSGYVQSTSGCGNQEIDPQASGAPASGLTQLVLR